MIEQFRLPLLFEPGPRLSPSDITKVHGAISDEREIHSWLGQMGGTKLSWRGWLW